MSCSWVTLLFVTFRLTPNVLQPIHHSSQATLQFRGENFASQHFNRLTELKAILSSNSDCFVKLRTGYL